MMGKFRKNITLFLLLALLPLTASALVEEKSSVVGTFKAEAGVTVEGITVRLLDSFFLKEVARTITDRSGKFVLPNLLPGLYLISVDAASMKNVFKRIQVVSGTPTIIDIRPLMTDDEQKTHSAWERFKWTIRMAERNPLRNEIYPVPVEEDPDSDGLLAFLKNFQEENNIEGEFSYVSVGSGPLSSSLTHQMAQFAVQGDLDADGSWSFNGNFLTGQHSSYMAAGDVRYELFDHDLGITFSANDLMFAQFPDLLERQRISRFVQSTSAASDVMSESSRWVSSLNLQDKWELIDKLHLGYGVRIDYYGYMLDSMYYSPRVGASYDLKPGVAVHGSYFISSSAPGNYYLQPQENNPYIHDVAFVPYGSTLVPERTEGFESGIDFSGKDYRVSLIYSYEDMSNKIATVDLRNTPVNDHLQSMRPFVIFNATDLQAHGVEAQVQKKLSSMLTAVGSYNIIQSVPIYILEKGAFSKRQVFFKKGETSEDFHDVQAGIRANIDQTMTQVQANWKWSSGSPLVFGRKEANSSLSALDLEVYQGLPFQVFSASDLKFLIAIKNLLDQNADGNGNADYHRALVYGMPRVIAGGVLIEF